MADAFLKKENIFLKKENLVKNFVHYFAEVYSKIGPSIKSRNPDIIEFIDKDSATLKAFKVTDVKTLVECNELFNKIDQAKESMGYITAVATNEIYIKELMATMSDTFVQNIKNDQQTLREYHNKFLESQQDDDEFILQLIKKFKLAELFAFINTKPLTNKFIVEVIRYLLNEAEIKADPVRLSQLINFTEALKHGILGSKYINHEEAIYVSNWKPFEIVHYSLAQLTAISATQQVLIFDLYGSPLEFNVRPLIDDDFIVDQGLHFKATQGLNLKVIERYDTAKWAGADKHKTATRRTLGKPTDTMLVVESLAAGFYRKLYEGPRDDFKVSTRPYEYHMRHWGKISLSCFDIAHNYIIDYESEKRSQNGSAEVTRRIFNDLMREFEKLTIKSAEEFKIACVDLKTKRALDENNNRVEEEGSKIIAIVTMQLIEFMNAKGPENILSALPKMHDIANSFIKEIRSSVIRLNHIVTAKTFKEYTGKELENTLVYHFKGAIEHAIAELNRNNKWEDYDFSLKEYYISRAEIY